MKDDKLYLIHISECIACIAVIPDGLCTMLRKK